MGQERVSRVDLAGLLAAVEDAPPVAAAVVVGERLCDALGASEVTFLIADFRGGALIRLGHAGDGSVTRTQGRETGERIAWADTPHGRGLAGQSVVVERGADRARLFAPVTNRGEAIGVLELVVAGAPDERTVADVALAAHTLAYVIIANRRFTGLLEWGKRSVPLSLAAETSIACCPAPTPVRRGSSRSRAGWSRPATSGAIPSTSPSIATPCTCR